MKKVLCRGKKAWPRFVPLRPDVVSVYHGGFNLTHKWGGGEHDLPPKTTTPSPIVPDLWADLCVVSTFLMASLKTCVRLVHGQYAKHLYFNVWFEYKIKHFCFAGCNLQLLHCHLIHLQCKWRRKSKSILRKENVNNPSSAMNRSRNSIVLMFKLR